jgi:hypothetical protein
MLDMQSSQKRDQPLPTIQESLSLLTADEGFVEAVTSLAGRILRNAIQRLQYCQR